MKLKYEEFVLNLTQIPTENLNLNYIKELKRDFAKKYKLSDIPSNISLIRAYQRLLKKNIITKDKNIENVLRKRSIRSESGIVSVQVLTKPFSCPGKCIFCPNDPSMPKSYIKTEPGAMRALLNQFDPYKQVYNRLLSLTLTGHNTNKIEMIVLGGTRDVYPKKYKIEFIKGLYDACNSFQDFYDKVILPEDLADDDYDKLTKLQQKFSFQVKNQEDIIYDKTIKESIKKNESAINRIIGLTIETRPEYVTYENCQFRRKLGVTRIEMGVQSMFDDVLLANKRGHGIKEIRSAMHKLRQYAFKVSIHIMPGLYKSTIEKDIETFKIVFSDPFMKPDELKFYPTSVIPNTELAKLYEEKKYIPLTTENIKYIIKKVLLEIIPPYTRIKRLIRDIPSQEIVAGSKITNLSQLTQLEINKELHSGDKNTLFDFYNRLYPNYILFPNNEDFLQDDLIKNIDDNLENDKMITIVIGDKPNCKSDRNFVSLDTRSREIRNKWKIQNKLSKKIEIGNINKIIRIYKSSVGIEFFISIEDELGYLYGFTRLLLPEEKNTIDILGLGKNTALIRELHVYGNVQKLENKNTETTHKIQHKGFGKQLMELAENIAKQKQYTTISVISGVGVREYYSKLNYNLKGTYMVKKF